MTKSQFDNIISCPEWIGRYKEENLKERPLPKWLGILAIVMVAIALLCGYWADFNSHEVDATTGEMPEIADVNGDGGTD